MASKCLPFIACFSHVSAPHHCALGSSVTRIKQVHLPSHSPAHCHRLWRKETLITYQAAASMRARAAKNGNTCSEISHLVGRADDCEHFWEVALILLSQSEGSAVMQDDELPSSGSRQCGGAQLSPWWDDGKQRAVPDAGLRPPQRQESRRSDNKATQPSTSIAGGATEQTE